MGVHMDFLIRSVNNNMKEHNENRDSFEFNKEMNS